MDETRIDSVDAAKELIREIKAGQQFLDDREVETKKYSKAHREHKENLVAWFAQNGITELEVDGEIVKAAYKPEYTIAGGKKASDKRTKMINELTELGLIEPDKVETFQEVNGNALNNAMKKLALKFPEKYQQLASEKLVSVFNKADVKIK